MGHIVLRAGAGISNETLTTAVTDWACTPEGQPDAALQYQPDAGLGPIWTVPTWLFLVYGDPPFTAGGSTIPWRLCHETDCAPVVCTVDSPDLIWTDIESAA